MIISYEQIKAIGSEVEHQRGQAIIKGLDGAGDIGFHVNVTPKFDDQTIILVEVSHGEDFHVRTDGTVV